MSERDFRKQGQRGASEKNSGEAGGVDRLAIARHRARVQRKANGQGAGKVTAPQLPSGGGAALGGEVKGRMEQELGSDLSSVRVHTSGESAQAATDVGARAFTVGSDVHFAAGQFAPGTREGDRLLAHELTHVVQGAKSGVQRKPDLSSHKGEDDVDVSQPHEPAEQEADAVADHVTEKMHSGGSAKGPAVQGAKHAAPPKINAKLESGASAKLWRNKDGATAPKAEEAKAGPKAAVGDVGGFEQAMGLDALKDAKSSASVDGLMAKVMTTLEDRAKQMDKTDAEVEAKKTTVDGLLAEFGGTANTGVAGAVGQNADTLRATMAPSTGGTIREKMTVFFNFAGKFQDFIMGSGDAERAEFLGKAHVNASAIEARIAKLKSEGAATDASGKFQKVGGRLPALMNAEGAEKQQGAARDKRDEKKDAPAEANPTVGALGANPETACSQAELDHMFPDKKGEDGHVDAEAVKGEAVTWKLGVNAWKEKAGSKFVDDLKALNLPFGAGPSGTTARIFSAAELLGAPKDDNLRMACIGYLVPIHAHSLLEVVAGAKTHGVDAPDFQALGAEIYEHITPFDPKRVKELKKQFHMEPEAKAEEKPPGGGASHAPPPGGGGGGGGGGHPS